MSFAPTPQEVEYQIAHPNQNRAPHIVSSTTILLLVAYIGVILRGLARRKAKLRFEADDVLIVLALACLTAFAIILFVNLKYGFGKHIIYVTNLKGLTISYVIEILFYALATIFAKASILQLYCRIFRSKKLFKLSIALIIFVAVYCLVSFLVTALECIPISAVWKGEFGKCMNPRIPMLVIGVVNVITGFAILAIPIRFVLRLNMTSYRKCQVICVFLTGLLTCAFGIVRAVVFATAGEGDLSYNLAWPAIWAFAEISISIVAACMPTYGIFFAKTYKMPLTPPTRITRGSMAAAYRNARGSLSKTLSRQQRPPTSSDRSLLVSQENVNGSNEKQVPPVPVVLRATSPSTSHLTSNSLSSFQISFPSPVPFPSPVAIPSPVVLPPSPATVEAAFPSPDPAQAVQPQFVLDVSIPSHTLLRSSGNTDDTLGQLLSVNRGSGGRNEPDRYTDQFLSVSRSYSVKSMPGGLNDQLTPVKRELSFRSMPESPDNQHLSVDSGNNNITNTVPDEMTGQMLSVHRGTSVRSVPNRATDQSLSVDRSSSVKSMPSGVAGQYLSIDGGNNVKRIPVGSKDRSLSAERRSSVKSMSNRSTGQYLSIDGGNSVTRIPIESEDQPLSVSRGQSVRSMPDRSNGRLLSVNRGHSVKSMPDDSTGQVFSIDRGNSTRSVPDKSIEQSFPVNRGLSIQTTPDESNESSDQVLSINRGLSIKSVPDGLTNQLISIDEENIVQNDPDESIEQTHTVNRGQSIKSLPGQSNNPFLPVNRGNSVRSMPGSTWL